LGGKYPRDLQTKAERITDQQFLGRTEDIQVGVPFLCGCICDVMNFSHSSTGIAGADDGVSLFLLKKEMQVKPRQVKSQNH